METKEAMVIVDRLAVKYPSWINNKTSEEKAGIIADWSMDIKDFSGCLNADEAWKVIREFCIQHAKEFPPSPMEFAKELRNASNRKYQNKQNEHLAIEDDSEALDDAGITKYMNEIKSKMPNIFGKRG